MFQVPRSSAPPTASAPTKTPAPTGPLLADRDTLLNASQAIAGLRADLERVTAERDAARGRIAKLEGLFGDSADGTLISKHRALQDTLDGERLEAVSLRGEIERLRRDVALLSSAPGGGLGGSATGTELRASIANDVVGESGGATVPSGGSDGNARYVSTGGPQQLRARLAAVEHENALLKAAVQALEDRLNNERAVAKKASEVLNAQVATAHSAHQAETIKQLTHELAERNAVVLDLRQLLLAHASHLTTSTSSHGADTARTAGTAAAAGGFAHSRAHGISASANSAGSPSATKRGGDLTLASPMARSLGQLPDQLRSQRTAAGTSSSFLQFLAP